MTVDETSVSVGEEPTVDKSVRVQTQASVIRGNVDVDSNVLSAGFVAPKVHGCGNDLLRF